MQYQIKHFMKIIIFSLSQASMVLQNFVTTRPDVCSCPSSGNASCHFVWCKSTRVKTFVILEHQTHRIIVTIVFEIKVNRLTKF